MRLIDADALGASLGITDFDCDNCAQKGVFGCSKGRDFVNACASIKDAPTIQPQRRGRWIESNLVPSRKGKPDGRLFICSECNKGWVKHDRSMEGINFCPNCGSYNGGGA